jgi:hypothetical protein
MRRPCSGTYRKLYRFDFLMEYRKHKKLQPLVGEVTEADNLAIMSKCKDRLESESK